VEDLLQNLYESATAQNKPFQPGLSAIEPPFFSKYPACATLTTFR